MPDTSGSPSTASSVSSTTVASKTNTLSVTQVPKAFFHPVVLDALRDHFSAYGPLSNWVPLTGFSRIIVVFFSEDDAERAKLESDPVIVEAGQDRPEIVLRVYRADPSPTSVTSANFLQPPALERNFLISPPGSPPVGWEPIREEPPNPTPLADDLITALRKLQLKSHHRGVEVLVEPEDAAGVGVYVEDCEAEEDQVEIEEEDWVYGETTPARERWRPVATAMPPLSAGM